VPNSFDAECERLVSLVVSFARHMLQESGGFHPFGAAMANDGELLSVPLPDETDDISNADILRLLKNLCIKGAREGKYKATALTCHITLTSPDSDEASDAVSVSLDHRDGWSVILTITYKSNDGLIVFDEALIEDGIGDIFSPRPLS
jgi:hypothetical protein